MAGSLVATLISYRFLFHGTTGTWNTSGIQIYSRGVFLISRTGLYIMSNSWIQVAHNTSLTQSTPTPRLPSHKILEEGCRLIQMCSMDRIPWTSPSERISLTSHMCLSLVSMHLCSPLISNLDLRVSWAFPIPTTSRFNSKLWIVTSIWVPVQIRCRHGLLNNIAAVLFLYLLVVAVRVSQEFKAATFTHHMVLTPTY